MVAIPVITIVGLIVHTKHDVVSSGEGYGYEIGMTKREVYETILDLAPKEDYSALYVMIYKEGMNKLKVIPINELQYEDIASQNLWNTTIGEEKDFFNGVRLSFERNKLSEIYRHRQAYELP